MAAVASDYLYFSSQINDGIFSRLPYEIVYEILYGLNLKQRSIAYLVSTNWRRMIASFDDHNLVETRSTSCVYCNRKPYNRSHREIECNLCRSLHHAVIKHASDNSGRFSEFYYFASIPSCDAPSTCYDLFPDNLESISVLHLTGCKFTYISRDPQKLARAPRLSKKEKIFWDVTEFLLLEEIYFDSVDISPTAFFELINKCPSIVELTLRDCNHCLFNKSISVPNLDKLKKFHVSGNEIGAVHINARNLQEFHLFSPSFEAVRLDLCACISKLQVLKIDCQFVPIGFPKDISRFPRLRSLSLKLCRGLNKLEISSPQLEYLNLCDMVSLVDAVIVTPNLCSFKLIDTKLVPCSCPVVGSRLVEAEIGLKYVHGNNRLLQLRTFAENLGENLTFSLATDATESKEVRIYSGNLGSNCRPLSIRHINVEILFSWASRYKSFIDELFGYFHPQTLLVRVRSDALKFNFIQVLLDELEGGERGSINFYRCSNYMCFLKGFKILTLTTTRQGTREITLEFQWYYKQEGFTRGPKAARA